MPCQVQPADTGSANMQLIVVVEPPCLLAPPEKRRRDRAGSTYESSELGPDSGSSKRVMVVEDDFLVAMTVENSLADAGYRVTAVVPSGETALVEAERAKPDLVIMDIRLAGELDGIETACRLLARGIRCIFASAHSDKAIMTRGAAAEPLGWLTKPFSSNQLLVAVADALRPDSLQ